MERRPLSAVKFSPDPALPITKVIPELLGAIERSSKLILTAPPGAGKTTIVPLALLAAGKIKGRIIVLEPRRLAARAAAERMAQSLNEVAGDTVGYRMRGQQKTSTQTRIEVVTEGILTRMLQSDPELTGIGAVIFDEFHERSLNADLGLALCLEAASAFREDLRILVMSATLDVAPLVTLMQHPPVIAAEGRSFPVAPIWLDRPLPKLIKFETAICDLVLQALPQTSGAVLVFLPGEREIHKTAALLKSNLPRSCTVNTLFGAMRFEDQKVALAPAVDTRKIILATAIAEPSLTIEGIRVVVDGGLARRAQYDPGSGMSRLITQRASKAEATQRQGRAGRLDSGWCYKLWSKAEEGAMAAFAPPEISSADLAPLAIELAMWGASPDDLPLLTQPNPKAFAEAQELLMVLGALTPSKRLTAHGKAMARLPMHPRAAHMVRKAGNAAAPIASLLAEKDPLSRDAPSDISLRLEALRDLAKFKQNRPYDVKMQTLSSIKAETKRLQKQIGHQAEPLSDAQMIALAYPDRIGLRRKGGAPRFLLSGGKGAILNAEDPLSSQRLLVAADLDGNPKEAKIRAAIALSEAELRSLFADQIEWKQSCLWSKREARVVARKIEYFGALALTEQIWNDAPELDIARAMLEGVREIGFEYAPAARRFISRVNLVGRNMPDFSEAALMEGLERWLLPYLGKIKNAESWKNFDILPALQAQLSWEQTAEIDRLDPAHFVTPLNRKVAIDYSSGVPEIAVRLQEMFGQTSHPNIAGNPLKITLLSPAGRPLQTTMDLPGFWRSSYLDVRKDMRGRYPKHPWPENPAQALPSLHKKRSPK